LNLEEKIILVTYHVEDNTILDEINKTKILISVEKIQIELKGLTSSHL